MFTHNTATFRKHRRKQPENRRGHDEDDTFDLRRLMAIGLEMAAMTRVPALGWPSDLFSHVQAGITP